MQSGNKFLIILYCAALPTLFLDSGREPLVKSGCLACHDGIMPFTELGMMEEIRARGEKYGDPEGCVICHGGTPAAASKEAAHRDAPLGLRASQGPQRFYPNPGNALVAKYTCGQCHEGYPQRLLKSSISTKTEHIHRNLCLDALEKTESRKDQSARWFGRYAISDEDGLIPNLGSQSYKIFMASLNSKPGLFAQRIYSIPVLSSNLQQGGEESQCRNCHGGAQLQRALEDERGSGCSACHVPYRSDGRYLGKDPTINKSQPGKLLMHRLQGTANTRITLPTSSPGASVELKTFGGILLDNCFTCHHDVRKDDLNPIGAVMTHYGSFHQSETGGALLCQDCHTTIEMHGDGNIPLTSHAQMEVKCEDCHGTVDQAPWELPLGYNQKLGNLEIGNPRGLTSEPLDVKGRRYAAKDGYLLTSRGNPFGNVVKDGDRVVLYSATGQSFAVPILKSIGQSQAWKSKLSRQAMFEVKAHGEKMPCSSCHGDVAQPCFGCHVPETEEKVWGRKL